MDRPDENGELTKVDYAVVLCPLSKRNKQPNRKDLQRYVINHYAEHWCSIAFELEINTAIIEQDERECTVRLRKVLETWLNSTDDASWKTLEVAITNVLRAQQRLDPVDDIYVVKQHPIPQGHDHLDRPITSKTTKSRSYKSPSECMPVSRRNIQQQHPDSLLENLPNSFVEGSTEKWHQPDFCQVPQGGGSEQQHSYYDNYQPEQFSPRKIHFYEEKDGQPNNPSKHYRSMHQPTDGTNYKSVDRRHTLSKYNREPFEPKSDEMFLQQPCDSLSTLSLMDEPQAGSTPGLPYASHYPLQVSKYTTQYQSRNVVLPNCSVMPEEVNHYAYYKPQTCEPNIDIGTSQYTSQQHASKVVSPEKQKNVFIIHTFAEENTYTLLLFATKLREYGVNASIDLFERDTLKKNWYQWYEDELSNASVVLCIITPDFCNNVDPLLRTAMHNLFKKDIAFRAVFLDTEKNMNYVPVYMQDATCHSISSRNLTIPDNKEFTNLYAFLTDQNRAEKPNLGNVTELAPRITGQDRSQHPPINRDVPIIISQSSDPVPSQKYDQANFLFQLLSKDTTQVKSLRHQRMFAMLAKEMKAKWEVLARMLDLRENDLFYIKSDYRDSVQEQAVMMFWKWLKNNGSAATLGVLTTAVYESGSEYWNLLDTINKYAPK